jgi:hypothetical protein
MHDAPLRLKKRSRKMNKCNFEELGQACVRYTYPASCGEWAVREAAIGEKPLTLMRAREAQQRS